MLNITCSATTSIYNMPRIVETFQYFTDLNCDVHSSIVSEPDYLCIRHLPQELKDQINYKIDNFNVKFKDKLYWTEERKT